MAFLGADTPNSEALAGNAQRALTEATGLSWSVGIGDNHLRAMLATGFAKPARVYRLAQNNWAQLMADRPTRALWGIGAKKLADAGITTVAQQAQP